MADLWGGSDVMGAIQAVLSGYGASGGGGWLPSDLASIQHWYKVSSLVLSDNDPVSTWEDDFGTADLTSSGSARPTYKAAGYVEFDGTDDVLTATTAGSWEDFAIVAIVEVVATATDYA